MCCVQYHRVMESWRTVHHPLQTRGPGMRNRFSRLLLLLAVRKNNIPVVCRSKETVSCPISAKKKGRCSAQFRCSASFQRLYEICLGLGTAASRPASIKAAGGRLTDLTCRGVWCLFEPCAMVFSLRRGNICPISKRPAVES